MRFIILRLAALVRSKTGHFESDDRDDYAHATSATRNLTLNGSMTLGFTFPFESTRSEYVTDEASLFFLT